MSYIISTDIKKLEACQAEVDREAGYPELAAEPKVREPGKTYRVLRHVGPGVHAPIELGLAEHYAPIDTNEKGDTYALPVHEAKEPPTDAAISVVDTLPDDWKPTPWPISASDSEVLTK